MPPALLHAFAKPTQESFVSLVRSEGVRVWDDAGNEYLDALASLWYCQVGHGRVELLDALDNAGAAVGLRADPGDLVAAVSRARAEASTTEGFTSESPSSRGCSASARGISVQPMISVDTP